MGVRRREIQGRLHLQCRGMENLKPSPLVDQPFISLSTPICIFIPFLPSFHMAAFPCFFMFLFALPYRVTKADTPRGNFEMLSRLNKLGLGGLSSTE